MTVVLTICLVMLGIAAACTVVRMTVGPTVLDRALALDLLIAVAICALGLEAAINRHTHTLPILLVLTLLGFVGSVAVARFTHGSDDLETDRS